MSIVSKMNARDYVSKSVRPMKTMFRDFNMTDQQAYVLGKNIWGDHEPDTLIWGIDPESHSLGPEHFHTEVLDVLAKSMYPIASKRGDEIVEKAITSVTEAVYFIPVFIDPRLVDIVKRDTPFLAMIPKKTMAGKTVNIPRRTTGITPEFLTDAAGAISVVDQGYNDINVTVKYMYAAGQVTGPAMATTKETLNLKKAVIEHTFMDFQRKKEEYLLRSRIAAGSEGWAGGYVTNTNGYDGLYKRVHEDAVANETELAGAGAIGIGDVDDAIETILTNGGKPDFGVCDYNSVKVLMQNARTYQRLTSNEIGIGAPIGRITVDNVPIFATNQLPATANNRSLFIADTRAAELRTLLPDAFTEVAQDLTDSERFFWKTYETMVVSAPEWIATTNGGA